MQFVDNIDDVIKMSAPEPKEPSLSDIIDHEGSTDRDPMSSPSTASSGPGSSPPFPVSTSSSSQDPDQEEDNPTLALEALLDGMDAQDQEHRALDPDES
jgi:hypothetical protein